MERHIVAFHKTQRRTAGIRHTTIDSTRRPSLRRERGRGCERDRSRTCIIVTLTERTFKCINGVPRAQYAAHPAAREMFFVLPTLKPPRRTTKRHAAQHSAQALHNVIYAARIALSDRSTGRAHSDAYSRYSQRRRCRRQRRRHCSSMALAPAFAICCCSCCCLSSSSLSVTTGK